MAKESDSLKNDYRDVQGKTIFQDAFLCAQFLRNNIDNPLLKEVQPEDIEDFTERFIPYFGVEFEGDVIKRICIKSNNEEYYFYIISLIEHKSRVDYNVTVQLLKYMTCIWTKYEEEFGINDKGNIRNKSFRYPPIIPIVYYEGKEAWTAGMHLRDRVNMAEFFEEYIPDFTYELIDIHKISNQELLQRKDVISLIMLLNKIQSSQDLSEVRGMSADNMNDILEDSPLHVIDILVSVIRTLCKRINATQEEAESLVEKVRFGNMGYLFENMEPMDIQEERRKTAQAKAELEGIIQELTDAKEELTETKEELTETKEELTETKEELTETKEELTEAQRALLQKDARILELEKRLKDHNIHIES